MKFKIVKSDRINYYDYMQNYLKNGLTIVCLYYDYDKNYKGDFTISLGIEDKERGVFNTSDYEWKEYKVKSNSQIDVFDTWKKIWLEEANYKINRAYYFDYEEYSPNGQISIFITIK